jgi:metal-responsive CopG/Arc/MetJ family transcriptional regulator
VISAKELQAMDVARETKSWVSMRLPKAVLAEIDRLADKSGMTRSRVIYLILADRLGDVKGPERGRKK